LPHRQDIADPIDDRYRCRLTAGIGLVDCLKHDRVDVGFGQVGV
jgi:hypothetical protein